MGSPASPLLSIPDKLKKAVPDWVYRAAGITPPAPPATPKPEDTAWHDAQVKAANESFQKAAGYTGESHNYDSNRPTRPVVSRYSK